MASERLDQWVVARTADEALAKAQARFSGKTVTVTQDEDVLDTWFSSGIFPFSVFGWPNQTPDLKEFYPTRCVLCAAVCTRACLSSVLTRHASLAAHPQPARDGARHLILLGGAHGHDGHSADGPGAVQAGALCWGLCVGLCELCASAELLCLLSQVYLHAMVRDAHGRKMSKSLGNVIDPVNVSEGITLKARGLRQHAVVVPVL